MLNELQKEVANWSDRNFAPVRGHQHAMTVGLGVAEEVGELAHSLLKEHQGIRQNENHDAAGQDAVGDIVIYLADLCESKGWSLQDCVENAWREVRKRDWTKEMNS